MSVLTDSIVDSFTTTSRKEIIFYLRQLINDGDQVSVIFNEGRDTILTVLLSVDEEAGLLYFDWGSSESTNRALLRSDRNYFVAMPHGIRNQFVTDQPRATEYDRRTAFAVALPDKYVRLQRREYFRLVLPMTQRPKCTIHHAESEKDVELSAVDIGLGGLALETPTLGIPCEIGSRFEGVQVDLKDLGKLKVDIEVRYAGEITKGTKQVHRLGCLFQNLSSTQENLIQKFMTQIQREERAKLGR